ncbi:DnaJ domain-containing protein, partial [uncultured Fusobacterium sp.]|uniref:DnaJ domain-containing protein n=1 Tax=uncultured Fusobacterium sp. TaxID=159267 RepID=UPI0027DDF9C1
IKLAYKKLAKKYHPDFYQNNPLADLAEEKLKEVNEAYTVLTKNKASNNQTKTGKYYYTNETKVQKIVLYWQGYSWELKNGITEYNIFRKRIEASLEHRLIMYESRYKAYNSLDEFVSRDKRLFIGDIERVFSSLVDICIENDYDMLSAKMLTNNYFTEVAEEYLNYYNECLNFSNNIDINRNYEKEWKKTKDYYRGKTSLFDKAVRGVSNMYDEMGDNQKKEELYSNPETLRLFKEAYRNAMLKCMDIILEILKINYRPNEIVADSILENINRYPKEKKKEKLLQALIYNPYNYKIYSEILSNFGDVGNELSRIAVYFGQNIENLKKDKIDEYIKEFNDLKEKDVYSAIENFKNKMYLLGKNPEGYINLQEEIKKEKEQKINTYIIEFKNSVIDNEELAIKILKEKAKELELDLEKYINLREVITYEKNKKAEEYVSIFKNEVKRDKDKAELELKERINKLGLKLENFIDLDKEYQNLERAKKNKKYTLIILILIIFGFLIYDKSFKNKSLINIDPIPRVTNEKVLNLSKTEYLDSKNNLDLKKIAGNDYISYMTFDPNDKKDTYAKIYGKEVAYFASFVENFKKLTGDDVSYAYHYVLSCSRDGKLEIKVYTDIFLAFTIPNLEKPQEMFEVVAINEDESEYVPVDLNNLSPESKKHIKVIKKALKKFKEVSKNTSFNLGL